MREKLERDREKISETPINKIACFALKAGIARKIL